MNKIGSIFCNPFVRRYLSKNTTCGLMRMSSVSIAKISESPTLRPLSAQLTTPTTSRFSFKPCRLIETKSKRPPNYYEMLGISRKASASEIKTAYYNKAKQFHPDTKNSPNQTKQFQAINEAYSVLSDDSRRKEFDNLFVHPAKQVNEAASDHIVLPITFVQSVQGHTRSIHYSQPVPCRNCKSSDKNKPITVQVPCVQCGGTGFASYNRGAYKMQMKCQYCRGTRYTQLSGCPDCNGKGIILSQKLISVVVPPGTKDNTILRIRKPNDMEQFINVKIQIDHDGQFKRYENDVYSDVMVPFTVAILGGKQEVRDVYGNVNTVLIPPGTVSDTKICLAGKGMRVEGKAAGNHIIQIKIKIPNSVSERQRMMLASFFSQ